MISIKKRIEMEGLIAKTKHPVKESKKIPSSASYDHLYNQNGENPWNSLIRPPNTSHMSISQINIKSSQSVGPKSRRKIKNPVSRQSQNHQARSVSQISSNNDKPEKTHNLSLQISNHSHTRIPHPKNSPPRKLIISQKSKPKSKKFSNAPRPP